MPGLPHFELPLGTTSSERATVVGEEDPEEVSPRSFAALYVVGPRNTLRHLLQPGTLVRIGRSAESSIVIDDARASRTHTLLHVGESFTISDLGSANGTWVGDERLPRGEAREIALGDTFFVGNSALVLRSSGLQAPAPERVVALAEWRWSPPAGAGISLLRARPSQSRELGFVEAILAGFLLDPIDRLIRLCDVEVAIVVRGDGPAETTSLERSVRRQLGSWGISAALESAFVPADVATQRRREASLEFLKGSGVPDLRRDPMVVRDPAMRQLRRTLTRVAATPVSVLILGETGVGKDVAAAMLHELSPRAGKPLVRLNCASLPEALLESELFGYERGAFTGAVGAKPGLIETADGGTVFLDEIGDLALALQAKLLRALESLEITRVGGLTPRRVDVRFIAATNHDLEREVTAGRFRRDLFHRLNSVTVTVPPLRERRADIEPLARQFLDEACRRFQLPPAEVSANAIDALERHHWPGNVRELKNIIERAVVLTDEPMLEPRHLGLCPGDGQDALRTAEVPSSATTGSTNGGVPVATRSARGSERDDIERALSQCGGNQKRAAETLGIPRRTLVRKIAKLGLPRPRVGVSD